MLVVSPVLRWHVRNASPGPVERTSASASISVWRQGQVRPPTLIRDLPSPSQRGLWPPGLAVSSPPSPTSPTSGSGGGCQQVVLRQG